MKQLLRELSIISSTQHHNIIVFHGAYMSPSTSEVKILMEFCEGGSLESVGKKIREMNAVVGEKIAGRLAEGVRVSTFSLAFRGAYNVLLLGLGWLELPALKAYHSPRHQAIQHSVEQARRSQVVRLRCFWRACELYGGNFHGNQLLYGGM